MNKRCDIVVIGAGGVGCAIARELSRYQLQVTVLEKECDVAAGTSGRNSAVVHAGFNNKPGSLMAKLCVEGNAGFEQLCKDLDIPYKKTGKLLIAFDEEDLSILDRILEQGRKNGCEGLRIISHEEAQSIMPGVGGIAALLSPNTAIFDPFTYCIALAENAAANGVKFEFEQAVISIRKNNKEFTVVTADNEYSCRFVINCAGLYSDEVAAMAGISGYRIYPCRGEYFILDKIADELLPVPIYPAPKPGIGGLGVHLTPTIDGNIIIGPSAEYIDSKDDYSCTAKIMEKLLNEAKQLIPSLDKKDIIGNYCGIRSKQSSPEEGGFRDFVIKEEPGCPGFINLVGIESPGLTASLPIAKMVCSILDKIEPLSLKSDFIPTRKGHVRFRDLSPEQQIALIEKFPDYGEIVCRCQNVSKHEIREAIENPFGARSISSIKYRAWATTGRCNGGYCLAKIVDMLVNEYGVSPEEISYRGKGSELFSGKVK